NTSIVYNSFWDKQTSGITSSAGGVGKTTAEMMDINTYAGWGDNIWTIDHSNDYPRLVWENQPGIPIIDVPRFYSGGAGTINEPYLIAEPSDLIFLSIYSADWDKHFNLSSNIDLSGFVFDTRLIPTFSGVFDGDGYSISNLTIDTLGADSDYLGLFGNVIGEQAQIKNLGLESVSVTGGSDSWNVGGLCGRNTGVISNSYATGAVGGYRAVGGLCGVNYGTISNCYSEGSASGGKNVGSLCGYNGDTISNCDATGLVTGGVDSDSIGGLCGYNGHTISGCYSEGLVSGHYNVGGLCGWNWGTLTSCYATGSVTGDASLGGLSGRNLRTISDCYSTGNVTGDVNSVRLGGLCGYNGSDGTISNCYSIGSVSSTGSYLGGFCGMNSGIVYHSFWDMQASGTPSSAGGVGKTTVEMMDINTYEGWGDNIWTIDYGNDYPHLIWENQSGVPIIDPNRIYSGGSGDPNDPYLISESNDLFELGVYSADWDKHFKLMADIDMTSYTYSTAVISIFTGTFDGSDHKMLNLTIDTLGTDDFCMGLFGWIDAGGEVRNLELENVIIIGGDNSEYLGGLCGQNYGTISNCSSEGSVTGGTESRYLGGLCGYNHPSGTINDCYSEGSVTGGDNSRYLGGLAGYNDGSNTMQGTISHCGANVSVSGYRDVGGLCGYNYWGSTISNCYSTGSVSGDSYVGGLTGCNSGNKSSIIKNSYSTGPVSGTGSYLGGLCGENRKGTIWNCYSEGSVTGGVDSDYVGGLCGYQYVCTTKKCYASGSISGGSYVG
ncbi:MAG: GLUG motif-containing protein, partial [Planctomycetota bacterium]